MSASQGQRSNILTGSLSRSAAMLFCVITAITLGCAGLVYTMMNQQNQDARASQVSIDKAHGLALKLTGLQKQIQIDVVQVQQFLSDYSATRGLDGHDDGLKDAETYAKRFSADIVAAQAAARDYESPDLVKVFAEVETHFPEYYRRGVEMAKLYAAEGPEGGNKLMETFDKLSEEMQARLESTEKTLAAEQEVRAQAVTATEDGLEAMRQKVSLIAILSGAITALTSLAGIIVVGRWVVQPMRGVTEAFRKLSQGDTSLEIAAARRSDEIGKLMGVYRDFRQIVLDAAEARARSEAQDATMAQERSTREAERLSEARRLEIATKALGEALHKLAEGNVAYRIDTPFEGELDSLRADFNASVEKLQSTLRVVMSSSDAIRTGSQELRTAADDTSQRTEQQAASLEQTAAALDQITVTVRRTAEGAGQARTIVTSAREDADRSGEVVNRTMQAMRAISDSAQKITQIIGVIDEIAFQTNLLALNAGVEAARAGDAGRGFAVVASEVRALAQRSAGAAKEIKSLINMSSTQVSAGVDLVGEAAQTLERIMSRVGEVSEVVLQIATGAEDQATSLAEVSTAMSHMDQTTQQNAAMVEKSTAATHSLVKEVDQLTLMLSQFSLDSATAGRHMPAPKVAVRKAAPAPSYAPPPRSGSRTAVAMKAAPRAAAATESWAEF